MIGLSRVAKLKEHILSEDISGCSDVFTVFISVCNKKERALVFHGSGKTISIAWNAAEKRLFDFQKKLVVKKKPYSAVWAKADVVISCEEIKTADLSKIIVKNKWHNYTRVGISFDSGFSKAFLEAEVHGNKMIDYTFSQEDISNGNIDYSANLINLGNINSYLKSCPTGVPQIAEVPENITIFTTKGYFCDEDNAVYELYSNNADFGRRLNPYVDDKVINKLIVGASQYLAELIDAHGKFIYGYFPAFGARMNNYNIVRHASTLWSVINLYRISADDSLIPKIDKAVEYMCDCISYKNNQTAYLVDKELDEIKLGADGVAVIMLTEYMDVFNTDKHKKLVADLANGILELQNAETGGFSHVLNAADFSKKDEFRTVYYDGEATFALARAYSCTKDKRFLDAAIAAVEYFIRENYVRHRDHWVAYSLNEITKYVEDTRYFEFALRNIDENLEGIYHRETSFHTYLEMLMTGWQTLTRAKKLGISSDVIKNYDPTRFAQTIYRRARHMLNGYFYPEFAMYMKYPNTVVGSFHVRHHNFRVRIDDVQHFIGGYYFYCMLFDEIREYLTDDFISGLENNP
ncbi:MAG: glycosyl hydrolase family 88 [Oscillospiraceae bacterium]|nr:glycosyl hydrolase family 88 [Oscillospiraceae bacterium]